MFKKKPIFLKNDAEPDSWDDWGSPEIVIADKEPITIVNFSTNISVYLEYVLCTYICIWSVIIEAVINICYYTWLILHPYLDARLSLYFYNYH